MGCCCSHCCGKKNKIISFIEWTPEDVQYWLKVVGLQDLLKDYQMPDPLTGLILQILVEDKTKIPKYFKISNKSKELSLQFALDLLKNEPSIDYRNWRWSAPGVCLWLEYYGLQLLAPYFQETAIHGGVLFNYNFSNWLEYIQYPNNLERPLLEKSITCAILRARTTAHVFDSIPKPKNKTKPKLPADWSLIETKTWLDDNYFSYLSGTFQIHSIHGAILLELDSNDLKLIGIEDPGAHLLLNKIYELNISQQQNKPVIIGVKKMNHFTPQDHSNVHAQQIELTAYQNDPESGISSTYPKQNTNNDGSNGDNNNNYKIIINKDEPMPLRYDGSKVNVPFIYSKWLLKQQFNPPAACGTL